MFLLEVKPGDWVVHINTPRWGRCIAAQVTSSYQFDDGIECSDRNDFRHHFNVDLNSIIEFDRNDPNLISSVNLKPRARYHRVNAVADFIQSIENLKTNAVSIQNGDTREEFHLREKADDILGQVTELIQQANQSKALEKFLAKVIRRIPGVESVIENGSGWKSDFGADLIVTLRSTLGVLSIENRIIVQVKSYTGNHYDLEAVTQIERGIQKFNGNAGIIITTAQKTTELENAISEASERIEKPIELLAGVDVAKFVIEHAPEMLFNIRQS
jgi:restriction endonuclease Mrr